MSQFRMRLTIAAGAILALGVGATPEYSHSQVKAWAGTMDIPVYAEGKPDPNPPYDLLGGPINYPYALRQNLTDRLDHEPLRALYLENEYLKCSVLPDLGGHLYTCMDKLSGQPMFYANPTIKKARIGYRGAWAAFGDEFNFPVSHNWVSLSPVNFSYASHPDDSASVTVSNIDRVYGMEWTVEMVLRPRSTVLEEKVTLANRSDVRHRFYWWNNAGIRVWEDSRICYPTSFTAAHGFAEIDTWPVNSKGMDFSVLRNQQDGPVSRFVYGSREPFIGVWHPHTNTGIVHYAEYGALPGKKFWSWGDDAAGREWRHILSDDNSTYVEVQAGPFRNQETYAYLEPSESMHFSEYWIPVRGLGGVARGNLSGALNLERHGQTLKLAINVNHSISAGHVALLDGEDRVLQETLDLTPEKTWSREIPISDPAHIYTLRLTSSTGEVLLSQSEGKYDTTPADKVKVGPQAQYEFPVAAERSAEDWVQFGDQQEINGDLLGALASYGSGVERFPLSISLARAEGRLLTALLRYEEAIPLLEAAEARNVTDPETAYYLGLAYAGAGGVEGVEGLEKERKAREMLEAAARLHGLDAAAHLQLAELASRSGDLPGAEAHMLAALRLAPEDQRTVEEQAAILQAMHKDNAGTAFAKEALSRFPNSLFLGEMTGKPDLPHLAGDPYRVLEIAVAYMRLGFYPQAVEVLSRSYPEVPAQQKEPGTVAPRKHAVVLYYKAYCKAKSGRPATDDYAAAARAATLNVFPRGHFDEQVFRAALTVNARDAHAHYFLGADEFSRGMVDAAMTQWKTASEFDQSIPTLDASMGKVELKLRRNAPAALVHFEDGEKNDPANADVYTGLDQSLSLLERPAAKRSTALQHFPDGKNMPQSLVFELALTRAEAGDPSGAEAVFRDRFFSAGEGDTDVREIWIEVRLQQALELARAAQCPAAVAGVKALAAPVRGLAFTRQILPAMVAGARIQYLVATMEHTCGDASSARASFLLAAQATAADEVLWAMQAAKQLGQYDAAPWHRRLVDAHTAAMHMIGSADASYWMYVSAMLENELGEKDVAKARLEDGLRLPDRRLSYHLIRLARADHHAAG